MEIPAAKKWVAFVFLLLAAILFLIGFSTQYWYYEINNLGDEFYYGIWRTCSIVASTLVCVDWIDITSTTDWFKAVQAMESLGLIFLFVGYLLFLVNMFCKTEVKTIRFIAIAFLFAAAMFMLAGVIVFGVEADQNVINHLGFSFYFVVVSTGLLLIGDFFLCIF